MKALAKVMDGIYARLADPTPLPHEKPGALEHFDVNLDKQNAPADDNAPEGYDWLGQPRDPQIEALRRLDVDECDGCRDGMVRYCPIHGLNGTAPR